MHDKLSVSSKCSYFGVCILLLQSCYNKLATTLQSKSAANFLQNKIAMWELIRLIRLQITKTLKDVGIKIFIKFSFSYNIILNIIFHLCSLSFVSISHYLCYIILGFVSTAIRDETYENYMTVETFLPDGMEDIPSSEFCAQQKMNLIKDMAAAEQVSVHTEGAPLCQICKTNVPTRVAVPCGHWCGCYECVKNLIDNQRFFEVTIGDGSIQNTDIPLPVTCLICRAIIGKVQRVYE